MLLSERCFNVLQTAFQPYILAHARYNITLSCIIMVVNFSISAFLCKGKRHTGWRFPMTDMLSLTHKKRNPPANASELLVLAAG
jgi:hypothetical protein